MSGYLAPAPRQRDLWRRGSGRAWRRQGNSGIERTDLDAPKQSRRPAVPQAPTRPADPRAAECPGSGSTPDLGLRLCGAAFLATHTDGTQHSAISHTDSQPNPDGNPHQFTDSNLNRDPHPFTDSDTRPPGGCTSPHPQPRRPTPGRHLAGNGAQPIRPGGARGGIMVSTDHLALRHIASSRLDVDRLRRRCPRAVVEQLSARERIRSEPHTVRNGEGDRASNREIISAAWLVHIAVPGTVDLLTTIQDGDAVAADKSIAQMYFGFGVMFVHMLGIDHAGHAHGWMSTEYIKEVGVVDRQVGVVLNALAAQGLADSTLVIVTADHGGHGKSHGSASDEDMTIPWIVAGPGVAAGRTLTSSIRIYDTTATALWVLGIPIPNDMDGHPVREAFTQFGG